MPRDVSASCRDFADRRVVRERLVTIVYSVIGDTMRPDHDNAVMHGAAGAVIKRTFEDR